MATSPLSEISPSQQFLEILLQQYLMPKSVLVLAPADYPPLVVKASSIMVLSLVMAQ